MRGGKHERLPYDLSGLTRMNDRVAELMQAEYSMVEIAALLNASTNHVRVCATRVRRGMGEYAE